jgi:hypothetical protein
MFVEPLFLNLGIDKVRYVIAWDAMRHPAAVAAADAYVQAARLAGVNVLMHISTNDYRPFRARLPTVSAYRVQTGLLIDHFRPQGVAEWGVWNEVNHKSEPTYRSPARAAAYYVVLRRLCAGCKVVALDVLDHGGTRQYVRRWFAALPRAERRRPVIVGIHNYVDTNRYRSIGTRSIIATVRALNHRSRFWLTETGGLVHLARSFPCNEHRAARAATQMFAVARQFSWAIDRLYAYSWTGTDCKGFDAGLTRRDGSARPAYRVFKAAVRRLAGNVAPSAP